MRVFSNDSVIVNSRNSYLRMMSFLVYNLLTVKVTLPMTREIKIRDGSSFEPSDVTDKRMRCKKQTHSSSANSIRFCERKYEKKAMMKSERCVPETSDPLLGLIKPSTDLSYSC